MKYLLTFDTWISESTEWKNRSFLSSVEKSVADIAEQELLTTDLLIINDGDSIYDKLNQVCSSSGQNEKVLDLSNNIIIKFQTPFEFLKWDILGADKKPIESFYIIKRSDNNKA